MSDIQRKTGLFGRGITIFFFAVVGLGISVTTDSIFAAGPAYCTNSANRSYQCVGTTASCPNGYSMDQDCSPACTNAKNPKYCFKSAAAASCRTRTHQCLATCSGDTPVHVSTCDGDCNGGWLFCVATSTTPTPSPTGINNSGDCSAAGYEKVAGVCFPKDTGLPDPQGGILEVLGNFFGWLLAIFGFLSIGAFIISGIQYLVAAGDNTMIETAKRNMKWSIVGVLVGLSGWIIMLAVARALSASPLF